MGTALLCLFHRVKPMRRLLLLAVVCLASCKHTPPPPPPQNGVAIDAPGVHIRVQDNFGVSVADPSGRMAVPFPGR